MADLSVQVVLQGVNALSPVTQQASASLQELAAAAQSATAALTEDASAEARAAVAAEALAAATTEETAAIEGLGEAAAVVKGEFIGGFGEMAAAFVGFEAAREIVGRTIETSREMQQAQLQLSAVFGQSAEEYAKFAEQSAAGTNFTAVQFERASVVLSELQRDYGLTDEQMKALLGTTADLAASMGVPLVQAAQDVRGTMQGMSRAGAELGLNMRSQVIASMDGLTEAQRKALTGTDANAAAMARLAVIEIEGGQRIGEAGRQAGEAGDKFAQLDHATAHLFETLAGGSTIGAVVGDLGTAVTAADQLVQIFGLLTSGTVSLGHAYQGLGGFLGDVGAEMTQLSGPTAVAGVAFEGLGKATSLFGQGLDLVQDKLGLTTAAQASAAQGGGELAAKQRDAAQAANQHVSATAEEKKALDELGQSLAKVAVAEGDLASRHPTLDMGQLTGVDWSRSVEGMKALADQGMRLADSVKDSGDAMSRHLGLDMQTAMATDNRVTEAGLKQQEEERKKSHDEAEKNAKAYWDRMNALTDRGLQDQRRLEDRSIQEEAQAQQTALKDQEQAAVASLQAREAQAKASIDAEISAREAARDAAVSSISDQEKAAHSQADAAKRDLDDQAKAAEEAERAQLRALENEQRAAEQAHQATVRQITDERDARLSELDAQLQQLNAQERALGLADQARKNTQDLRDAQAKLAQDRAAGSDQVGADQEKLRDVQARIALDAQKQQIDAQKQALNDQKAAVKDQSDAQKQAADDAYSAQKDGITSQKQAVQDGLSAAKDAISEQKQAVDDGLKAKLDALNTEKQAAQDSAKTDIDALKVHEKDVVDSYTAQEKATADSYKAREAASAAYWAGEKQRIDDARHAFDEYTADTRYGIEHPGQGGEVDYAGMFGGTSGGSTAAGAGAGGGFGGQGGRQGGATFQINVYASGGDGASIAQAAREGVLQALQMAGSA